MDTHLDMQPRPFYGRGLSRNEQIEFFGNRTLSETDLRLVGATPDQPETSSSKAYADEGNSRKSSNKLGLGAQFLFEEALPSWSSSLLGYAAKPKDLQYDRNHQQFADDVLDAISEVNERSLAGLDANGVQAVRKASMSASELCPAASDQGKPPGKLAQRAAAFAPQAGQQLQQQQQQADTAGWTAHGPMHYLFKRKLPESKAEMRMCMLLDKY